MVSYFFIVSLITGLAIGSFLNVLIYRIPRGIGFVKGRSFCPKCKKKINWYGNIPVISFVLLKGRCRKCQSPISLRYPVVELLTGVLFVLGALGQLGKLGELGILGAIIGVLLTWVLFSALIVIFFIDLEHQIIPDQILLPIILLFFVWNLVIGNWLFLLSGFISSLFFLLVHLVTKGKGMGLGDVKLAFLMGLALGFPKIVVAVYLAFLTGAVVGTILILGKKAKFGQKIAFGPFLSFSTIITFLWGEKIIDWLQKILF